MNEYGKRVIAAAKTLGWTVGSVNGCGHVELTHPNGSRYSTAATPSEWRGAKNAIADLERLAGAKLDRPNHRRSRKADEVSGFSLEAAVREAEARRKAERAESIRRATIAAEERRRQQVAANADRNRREIERLMQPGWGA